MSSGPYSFETGYKKTFHIADYAVFGCTLVASAAIGIFYMIKDRHNQTTDEYSLGGRRMHPIPVAMSMLSSFISAIGILGIPSEIIVYSTMYWWISISMLITAAGAANIFIPIFYNLGITSVYEYVEMRFGYVTRVIACITYLVLMIFFMAIVLYAPSLALNAVTDLSLWGSVLAVGLVCVFYTAVESLLYTSIRLRRNMSARISLCGLIWVDKLRRGHNVGCLSGGMKAVLWVDTLQMLIVFAGMLTILFVGANNLGGMKEAWNIADKHGRIVLLEFDADPRLRHSVWSLVIGGGIYWCSIFGTNQAQVQRAISVKSVSMAKLAMWLNFPGMVAIITIFCLVGVVMSAFYSKCDPVKFGLVHKPDQLLPLYVMDLLGDLHGLPGLLLSCVFSGSLSSISSGLNAVAAVMLEDFVKPFCCGNISPLKATWMTRAFVVFFGLLSLALAFIVSQVEATLMQLGYVLFGVLSGPLLGLFTLGMLFPWANKWGGGCGILTSLMLLLWIGLGASFSKTSVTVKSSVSLEGCNWNITGLATPAPVMSNVTTIVPEVTTHIFDKYSGLERLYTVSYMWYTGIGVCTVVVVGLIVSFITGKTDPSTLNPKLICPFFDIFCPFLPEKVRKPLRFGVRHGEVYDGEIIEKKDKVASVLADEYRPHAINAKAHDNKAFNCIDTRL